MTSDASGVYYYIVPAHSRQQGPSYQTYSISLPYLWREGLMKGHGPGTARDHLQGSRRTLNRWVGFLLALFQQKVHLWPELGLSGLPDRSVCGSSVHAVDAHRCTTSEHPIPHPVQGPQSCFQESQLCPSVHAPYAGWHSRRQIWVVPFEIELIDATDLLHILLEPLVEVAYYLVCFFMKK